MNVAFDIDGVVVNQDIGILRLADLMDNDEARNEVFKYYFMNRKIDLNPLNFLHPGDKLYFITGRNRKYIELTRSWAKQYFPQAKIVVLNHREPIGESNLDDWFRIQAELKAEALKKNNIRIYFEDTPEVVKHLREIIPECVILQYGGRLFDRRIV